MRLDKFLAVARLVKQRTRAKELCRGGHVKVAGKTAKAAHEVRVDDAVEITLPRRRLLIKITKVPSTKSVPKAEAPTLYETVHEEKLT